jgi:ATP/maltotriose-dependent transcriptional regulator MalT
MQVATGTPQSYEHPQVIRSKLTPPAAPDRFSARPRLERLVARLMDRKRAIVVTATAGSGKTTVVAAATRRSKRSVVWLTVDRPDRAPGRLLTYLEAALERQRAGARRVATGALAAGIPHAEAAGLLAEAIGIDNDPLVIVLDELERLGEEPEAWRVVEALLRYAPTGTCLILISRRDIPTRLCTLPSPAATAVLQDADLAFTREEAERALARSGKHKVDVATAVESTAGWVTGVLFEGWRSAEHVAAQGGETDPLYDYLSSQILGQLEPAEREFLIATSVLDDVTVPRAQALGLDGADEHLGALRSIHLPASWAAGGRVMRCHTYFRDYLLAQLERRGEHDLQRLRLAYGRRLAVEGHDEEAAEELLRAGAIEEALASAERAIVPVVERLDLSLAERWLGELAPVAPSLAPALVTAELLLAIARDEIGRGVQVADRLAARGERETLARSSERAGLLMVWCYLHVGRVEDVDAVLAAVEPGPASAAVRYARDALFGMGENGKPVAPDPAPTGPIGAIVCNADYALGRLSHLTGAASSSWTVAMERPWRAAALRARGRTEQALALFEDTRTRGVATTTMLIFAGPEVLMDAGRFDDARQLLGEAREVAAASGSFAYQGCCAVLKARLELRQNRDFAAARAALDEPLCRRAAEAFRFIGEVADVCRGFALLLEGDDEQALECLRRAARGMLAGDRILELPTAAVYLAEAEWRGGDEDAADAAADLALDAARRQGSNHLLLGALADFPAVASRRLDAEADADSAWHEVGRALVAQGAAVASMPLASVELLEFGRRAIVIDGEEVRPRIAKSYELLAYLAAHSGRGVEREELLEALFGERRDESARAYLRQAIHRLKSVLPEGALQVENGHVRLCEDVGVNSESVALERALAEAARLQGDERLATTLAALSIYDRGEYLPGPRAGWADGRQQQLADLVTEARYQAAVLAFGTGRYDEGRRLVTEVLGVDPLREAAWRLEMRIAQALGDEDGVLRSYHGCEAALAELQTAPSASTRQLLERLRS